MVRTLSVWVGAQIIYLYGTVNGETATFTLIGNGEWQSTVPRSEDDNYELHLEAYSANGLEGTYDYTLYYGMMLCVTDRKKGAYYNASDLNRVEHNVNYLTGQFDNLPAVLADYLDSLGVAQDKFFEVPYEHPLGLVTMSSWVMGDIPNHSDMTRYLGNVKALKETLPLENAPALPSSAKKLTVDGANNIEKVLRKVNDATLALEALKKMYADNTAAAFWYSGELFSGEV